MTQQKLNFIVNFSKLLAVIVLTVFCVIICYQFVILSGLNKEKNIAENNLNSATVKEEKLKQEIDYLKENYNQYLDDTAKDELGLVKENQTVIYGE